MRYRLAAFLRHLPCCVPLWLLTLKHALEPFSAGLLGLDGLLLHFAGNHRLFQHVTKPLVALDHAPEMVALRLVGLNLPACEDFVFDLRHRLDVDAVAQHLGGELAAFEFFLWGHNANPASRTMPATTIA